MMKSLCVVGGLLASSAAQSQLIISEIMYDPSPSAEALYEYVEIVNVSEDPIDLTGFVFDDGNDTYTDRTVPGQYESNIEGVVLGPGDVGVLFNADSITRATFLSLWGSGVNAIEVSGWRWADLSNDVDVIAIWSSVADYALDLRPGGVGGVFISPDNAVASVRYENVSPWPANNDSASIFLNSPFANANAGQNWTRSALGDALNSSAGGVGGGDVGSPGVYFDVDAPPPPTGCSGTPVPASELVPLGVDAWQAPSSYYNGVSGTSSALKSSLQSAMSSGHIQRSYGDFRYSSRLHDADPNHSGNIMLVYNRASVSGNWDSGSTWNREHVWPQSRQPGDASNSTRGNLGDPHSLRPLNPGINSSRGNKPYGFANTTGGFGSQGSFYFPGDQDKGDIARCLFYSATRYTGLTLVNGSPGGNQMGDLAALIAWHYLDIPDEFERRRNHVIYSQSDNPSYYTRNRNAFVDLPGAAWGVYIDNFNDSQLWVGEAPGPMGDSTINVCQRLIEGAIPSAYEVQLNRGGSDGVYYAVLTEGDAMTDQPLTNGFTGAFPINNSAPRSIVVGIDPGVMTGPGLYRGTVTIDNLDMTSGLGPGRGGLDEDDQILISYDVLAASEASFSPSSSMPSERIALGTIVIGENQTITVPVYALEPVFGFTAGSLLSLGGVTGNGIASIAEIVLPQGVLDAGESDEMSVILSATTSGPLAASIRIETEDDPSIAGAESRGDLTVTIQAIARGSYDVNADGVLDFLDMLEALPRIEAGDRTTDFDADTDLDGADVFELESALSGS